VNGDDPYLFPGTSVLRNRLGLTDPGQLDKVERRLVAQRIAEGVPTGDFDLIHLRAIHRQLFQDVYDWAGDLRSGEISKGGHQFQFRQYIETGMADIHRRLRQAEFLRGLSAGAFAEAAAPIMGDVNYVHPFREGNGRVQLQYLEQLAEQAGHPIDLTRIEPQGWLEASRSSHEGDHGPMVAAISRTLRDLGPGWSR
jgi:cell filamentation protein